MVRPSRRRLSTRAQPPKLTPEIAYVFAKLKTQTPFHLLVHLDFFHEFDWKCGNDLPGQPSNVLVLNHEGSQLVACIWNTPQRPMKVEYMLSIPTRRRDASIMWKSVNARQASRLTTVMPFSCVKPSKEAPRLLDALVRYYFLKQGLFTTTFAMDIDSFLTNINVCLRWIEKQDTGQSSDNTGEDPHQWFPTSTNSDLPDSLKKEWSGESSNRSPIMREPSISSPKPPAFTSNNRTKQNRTKSHEGKFVKQKKKECTDSAEEIVQKPRTDDKNALSKLERDLNKKVTDEQPDLKLDRTRIPNFEQHLRERDSLHLFDLLPHHSKLQFEVCPGPEKGRISRKLFVGTHSKHGVPIFAYAPGSVGSKPQELKFGIQIPGEDVSFIICHEVLMQDIIDPFNRLYVKSNISASALQGVSTVIRLYFCMRGYLKESNMKICHKKLKRTLQLAADRPTKTQVSPPTSRISARKRAADTEYPIRRRDGTGKIKIVSGTNVPDGFEEGDIQSALRESHDLNDDSDDDIEMQDSDLDTHFQADSDGNPTERIIPATESSISSGSRRSSIISEIDLEEITIDLSSDDGFDSTLEAKIENCRDAVEQNRVYSKQIEKNYDKAERIGEKIAFIELQEKKLRALREELQAKKRGVQRKAEELATLRHESYKPFDKAVRKLAWEQFNQTSDYI
ncbi:hypothetical protein B0J11DRAFT_539430 [Dendryphion nanum]|uniref:Uncharacterized protein n=1 Tax=Dendryphion nanum TaxID=256645 RepID=A0A9P9DBA5_9PLEO|nr:hypothetical protein B0J11DRAFT_539430 [Dendryphion nanum]